MPGVTAAPSRTFNSATNAAVVRRAQRESRGPAPVPVITRSGDQATPGWTSPAGVDEPSATRCFGNPGDALEGANSVVRDARRAAGGRGAKDGREGLALAHSLHGRAHGELFHVARDACLDDGAQALVELHRAHGVERRRHIGALDGGCSQPEVLLHGDSRTHVDAGRAGLVRIDRHQLHVHERRLARLVEALRRHHGVVPVEDLPVAVRGTGRCHGRRHHARSGRRRTAAAPAEAAMTTSAVAGGKRPGKDC